MEVGCASVKFSKRERSTLFLILAAEQVARSDDGVAGLPPRVWWRTLRVDGLTLCGKETRLRTQAATPACTRLDGPSGDSPRLHEECSIELLAHAQGDKPDEEDRK